MSERGNFGFSRLSAEKECIPALGYVVENAWLGAVLTHQLFQYPNIEVMSPARVETLSVEADGVSVSIQKEDKTIEEVKASLVVAADGQESQTRSMLGIDIELKSYRQKAIIANVSPDKDHQFVAYERFTENGPLALLPLKENRYALVWTLSTEEAEETLTLSDVDFLAKLQSQFGHRIGDLIKSG